ncbi:40S ribosomal protein SA [Cricetulus griseus]|uniref:40S ribosomal protein SA n=1 Tax=Cricetulus griseus TaxID=10029 RepID=G3IFH1_CRIGR|nr:40S ribosomal protein SA [Cricetulus griseus]
MSGALDVLQMKEDDVLKFLAAGTHLGGTNFDFQMEQYIYKRKNDGIYIINLKRTWEKLLLAARPIVATENPADVRVISSRNTGQQTVLKFAAATGATPIAGLSYCRLECPASHWDWSAASTVQVTEWVGATTEWS